VVLVADDLFALSAGIKSQTGTASLSDAVSSDKSFSDLAAQSDALITSSDFTLLAVLDASVVFEIKSAWA
jgi:hypothetical protein